MPTPNLIEGNAVIGQGGGPTAVINQSLVGVVETLRDHGSIPNILGMRHGVKGMVNGDLTNLSEVDPYTLEEVSKAPSAALGSTRDKPDVEYCARIFDTCKRHDVRYFFYIGGNDSSDTCRIVNKIADEGSYELRCFHIPKTIDNDLLENDHTPGFPSAARFVAWAFAGDDRDNAALPGIKINVVMGRHAGFLTGASAMARTREGDGPHLIYLPERKFDLERFAADVDRVYTKHGRCLIAVSEGIQNEDGLPIAAALSERERDAHGNIQLSGTGALGDMLSDYLKKKLKSAGGKPPRVRADTFGYSQRCWPDASPVDAFESRQCGRAAARLAMSGDLDGSIAIKRLSNAPYRAEFVRVDLDQVAGKTRHMPEEFMRGHNDVSDAFIDYLRPLLGTIPSFARL
ncbi:MAG: 6-phosphofructokinase [Phycisphaeraceae bacterium]|nr:6-phosphofructokinase [Phycisphaeraceae bacterium]